MKNDKIKNALWLVVFAIATLASICWLEGVKITGQNMAALGVSLLIVMGICCGILVVITWAGNAKEDHENREKDDSISYRFSQSKYIAAIAILGLFALVILYGWFHGLFVPGTDF